MGRRLQRGSGGAGTGAEKASSGATLAVPPAGMGSRRSDRNRTAVTYEGAHLWRTLSVTASPVVMSPIVFDCLLCRRASGDSPQRSRGRELMSLLPCFLPCNLSEASDGDWSAEEEPVRRASPRTSPRAPAREPSPRLSPPRIDRGRCDVRSVSANAASLAQSFASAPQLGFAHCSPRFPSQEAIPIARTIDSVTVKIARARAQACRRREHSMPRSDSSRF